MDVGGDAERSIALPKLDDPREGEGEGVGGDDDDDPPMLSSQALEALKEFLAEQNQVIAEDTPCDGGSDEVTLLSEDWRLSQFWYEPDTANTLAQEVFTLCQSTRSSVACIACPTLFAYIKKFYPTIKAHLLEYDKRFEEYGRDFTFYDYNQPEELPSALKHAYQVVIADPPYLSQECLDKVSRTISFLSWPRESYLLLLTGEVQKDRASELLGLLPCGFRPQHTSKLGNEFSAFYKL